MTLVSLIIKYGEILRLKECFTNFIFHQQTHIQLLCNHRYSTLLQIRHSTSVKIVLLVSGFQEYHAEYADAIKDCKYICLHFFQQHSSFVLQHYVTRKQQAIVMLWNRNVRKALHSSESRTKYCSEPVCYVIITRKIHPTGGDPSEML